MTPTLDDYLARLPMPRTLAAELQTERRRLGATNAGDLAEEGLRTQAWRIVMERREVTR